MVKRHRRVIFFIKPDDNCILTDLYALIKYKAEQGLLGLAEETGMEVVIIRSPLVYGSNVKQNFVSMMKWVTKKIHFHLEQYTTNVH